MSFRLSAKLCRGESRGCGANDQQNPISGQSGFHERIETSELKSLKISGVAGWCNHAERKDILRMTSYRTFVTYATYSEPTDVRFHN
jgi:hypothetical protein